VRVAHNCNMFPHHSSFCHSGFRACNATSQLQWVLPNNMFPTQGSMLPLAATQQYEAPVLLLADQNRHLQQPTCSIHSLHTEPHSSHSAPHSQHGTPTPLQGHGATPSTHSIGYEGNLHTGSLLDDGTLDELILCGEY